MNQIVPAQGPLNAKIVPIGEAPWKDEVLQNRPFAGASGAKLAYWWSLVGLDRSQMRIENMCHIKPPRIEIESHRTEVIVEWMRSLHDRIAALEDPVVLVPMGNYATFALTGKGKVKAAVRNHFTEIQATASEADKKAGITKLRGSIYQYQDKRGRLLKVIPTIHPAAVLYSAKWERRTIADWRRIYEESFFREYLVPKRNTTIEPTEWEVEQYVRFVLDHQQELVLALDIETWGNRLSCVGFSYRPEESITLDVSNKERYETFMPYIKKLCECQAPKALCNGLYDWYWLDAAGVQIQNFIWDVQLMHHAFDPIENHSLDFLASIYTKQMYWKDESKDAEEIVKYAKDQQALWTYNGLDCCVTRELVDVLYRELEKRGLVPFYFQHYVNMLEPLLRTMRHGIRVDRKRQASWAKKLLKEVDEIREELKQAAGEELFATERETYYREPTAGEWEILITDVLIMDGAKPPKPKYINREARQRLINETDCTYMISGANAGKMKCHREKVKKSFSGKKLHRFFYETLKVPKQKKWGKKNGEKALKTSVDEAALRKMTKKHANLVGNWANLVIAVREKQREAGYLKGAWDKDGRIRCSYKMITEAGRLASSKNPMRRGYNLQNIKR